MFKLFNHKISVLSFLILMIQIITTMANDDTPGTPVMINENATNSYITEYGTADNSAHRSGADIAPQNTLMAFENVIRNNDEFDIDIFEFDVQITKDGEIVLLHNLTYDETSNAVETFGHKKVSPMFYTLDELQCLNLGEFFEQNGTYPYQGLRGEDIPYNLRVVNLETVLDYIESNFEEKDFKYIIEIKSPFIWGQKACDKLYKILKDRDLLDRTIAASFRPSITNYMEKQYPDMQRSAGIVETLEFYIYCRAGWDLSEADVRYIALQIPFGENVMPFHKNIINLGTREVINYAHKYNIAVQYWTIDDVSKAEYLINNNADALMADDPQIVNDAIKNIQMQNAA